MLAGATRTLQYNAGANQPAVTDLLQFSTLRTQLQAAYDLTAQISQLSMVHFMPVA